MRTLTVELTNRCNLSCDHCFTGRHGGTEDLSLELLGSVLSQAAEHGFSQVSFTGGDPTVHRSFGDAIHLAAERGFRFGLVTNGWNFPHTYHPLVAHRDALAMIAFSLDGSGPATHDALRGAGSHRRVLQAVGVCVAEQLPFSFNMVVTAHNRHEISDLVRLAERVGASAVRLSHLIASPITTLHGADLTPQERRAVEAEVALIAATASVPVAMAPGSYTTDLFPCAPLNLDEVNIDVRGNMTKCCHLSGHGPGHGQGDIVANLGNTSFGEALDSLRRANETFCRAKERYFEEGGRETDYFPCWYCTVAFGKADWLASVPDHPWGELLRRGESLAPPAAVPPPVGQ